MGVFLVKIIKIKFEKKVRFKYIVEKVYHFNSLKSMFYFKFLLNTKIDLNIPLINLYQYIA